MKKLTLAAMSAVMLSSAVPASAELVLPLLSYRTGPFAPNGIPIADGFSDYLTLINERDGGIGGEKIKMIECERIYLFAQEAQKLNDQSNCDYLSVWKVIQYFANINTSSSSSSSNDWRYVDLACIMQRCLSGDKTIEWSTVLTKAQAILEGSGHSSSKSSSSK